MIQNGNPPDILNLNAYASYAKDDLLYSADEVLSPAVKSDLLDAFVKSGTYQGKLYGMPDLSLGARAVLQQGPVRQGRHRRRRRRPGTSSRPTPRRSGARRRHDRLRACRSGRRRRRPSSRSGCSTTAATGSPTASGRSTAPKNVETLEFLKKLANRGQGHPEQPGQDQPHRRRLPRSSSPARSAWSSGFSPAGRPARQGQEGRATASRRCRPTSAARRRPSA